MSKNILIVALLTLLGAGGAYVYVTVTQTPSDSAAVLQADVCPEHGVAEVDCPWCDPGLIQAKGICAGHDVPEALCWKCNPDLVAGFKAENDWCAGHSVPESQCTICNPGLLDRAAGKTALEFSPEIEILSRPDVPRSQRIPSVSCATETLRIQFTSPEIAANTGLQYARVERREITETITSNAEITFDANRYAHLSSRAPGVVHEVNADLGQTVEAGETLAVIDSVDLGAAKSQHLQAEALVKLWEKNFAREKRLNERGIATERELLEAETKLAESRIALTHSRQRLMNLGLTDSRIAAVSEKNDASSLLALNAPFSGTVVERHLALGEVVDTSRPLFAIADTSTMWAMLDFYEDDIARLQMGLPVVLEVTGRRGERHAGRITWISSHVDARTRTLKARAEIANSDGTLRAGMFGEAIVHVQEREPSLVVPRDAVQWEGCCNVVFVRKSDTLFEPRKVRLGYETERFYVVEHGVEESDVVVTTGSYLLKTEILKGSIGAGCCEVNPGTS